MLTWLDSPTMMPGIDGDDYGHGGYMARLARIDQQGD
jgi:hypothetical protein